MDFIKTSAFLFSRIFFFSFILTEIYYMDVQLQYDVII